VFAAWKEKQTTARARRRGYSGYRAYREGSGQRAATLEADLRSGHWRSTAWGSTVPAADLDVDHLLQRYARPKGSRTTPGVQPLMDSEAHVVLAGGSADFAAGSF